MLGLASHGMVAGRQGDRSRTGGIIASETTDTVPRAPAWAYRHNAGSGELPMAMLIQVNPPREEAG